MWYKFGKRAYFVSKKAPSKKLEYRVMNIFEALPLFGGPAEGGSPRYQPLRLGPKIVGKCSLPYRMKISNLRPYKSGRSFPNQTRIFSVG
jgi:hypothetical protein